MAISIIERMKKASTIKESSVLSESEFFSETEFIPTAVPMLNVALSGDLDGGLSPGLTMIAGPSRHFKTSFGLVMCKAFQDSDPDAAILFLDSEFGSPPGYLRNFGLDTERILHVPIKNVEEMKFEIMPHLEEITKKDKVMIFIDSVGNVASKKEVEDAKDQKSVADMSRAKQLKSFFRIVTPYLKIKDIPMVVINHTYKEQALFPKDVVSGGTGGVYSSDTILIVGRQQEKTGTEIEGYNFVLKSEKSRFVKEQRKIPIKVLWEGGIQKWSGLDDVALLAGVIDQGKIGNSKAYVYTDKSGEEHKVKAKDIGAADEFWEVVLKETDLKQIIKKHYSIEKVSLDSDALAEVEIPVEGE